MAYLATLWSCFAILIFSGCVTRPALTAESILSFSVYPLSLHQGETFLVRFKPVEGLQGGRLSLRIAAPEAVDQIVEAPRVFACGNEYCALVGVGLDAPIGTARVSLGEGEIVLKEITLPIKASTKPVERLRVDPSRVTISPENQRRVDEERKLVGDILSSLSAEPLESFGFHYPVKNVRTSAFGKKRIFNSENRGYHTGLDLRASTGAPVKAANSGTVRIARNLFMAGGHVLIDHGGGVVSSYSHLSEILVKEGQRISIGDLVGKAGATGRVTAPHLHWTIRVEKQVIDPGQFMTVISQISSLSTRSSTQ